MLGNTTFSDDVGGDVYCSKNFTHLTANLVARIRSVGDGAPPC